MRLIGIPLLTTLICVSTLHFASAQAGVALTRGPYLGNQTATSVQLIWSTNVPAETRVDFGAASLALRTIKAPQFSTLHVVTLTNLLTGTTYFYQTGSLATSTFTTNRDDADPNFTFAAFGDSGIAAVVPILRGYQYAIAALLERLRPSFVVHTGDVIYNGGEYANFDPEFFAPYSRLLRSVPFYTSMGNHDYVTANGQPYLDNFFLPANNPLNTRRYYSFDYGNAHFIALDSNQSSAAGTPMALWLANDLGTTHKFWKFVFFHHPLYTSGPHSLDPGYLERRENLAPLFDQYHVDVVFSGHDHDYERTLPIHNGQAVRAGDGVVYIVSGGGGAALYPVGTNAWTALSSSVHHVVQVSVAGCRLTLSALQPSLEPANSPDTLFDSTSLDRCERVYLPTIATGMSNTADTSATRRARLRR